MKSSQRLGWTVVGVAAVVVLAAACAPADLGRAGSPDVIGSALGRSPAIAGRPVNQSGRPMAYLALGGSAGSRLAAFDLQGSKLLWSVSAGMTGRVVVGISVVVHADGGALVARDGGTGLERWRSRIPVGETLVGYAIDGDIVYFVARRGHELRGGEADLVAIAGASGSTLWRRALGTANVAGPAARGGIVAVPNRSQFVTLFDGQTGEPLGQALSREQAADFVEGLPEGFFYGYGSDGVYLLSPETAVGVRTSPGYLHAKLPRFVRPVYHFDMYLPELMGYSAIDRNRILWRADVHGARAAFAAGTVCVLNYRFFFGFDAASGALRWVYNNPVVEAASAVHAGAAIVFATADGELGAIDPATGQRTYRARLPGGLGAVVGATFDAEGWAPRAGNTVPVAPSLAESLSSIVWDPDRRFSEAQIFAVEQLARIPGRSIAANLLKVLSTEGMPPAIVKRAARALVDRKDRDAVDLFVDAIQIHTDYVTGSKPANLEILARAVGALQAREAAKPLAEHLRLPETETGAVVEIARALAQMRAAETLPALRDYLAVYRADPACSGDPSGLLAVVDALLAMGGTADREFLLFVAEEPKTLPAVREHARYALARSGAGTPPAPPGGVSVTPAARN